MTTEERIVAEAEYVFRGCPSCGHDLGVVDKPSPDKILVTCQRCGAPCQEITWHSELKPMTFVSHPAEGVTITYTWYKAKATYPEPAHDTDSHGETAIEYFPPK